MTTSTHIPTPKRLSRHMRAGIASAASGAAGWAAGFGLGWPVVIVAAGAFIAVVVTLMWILSDGKRSLRLAQLVCAVRTGKLNPNAPSDFGIDQPEKPVTQELARARQDTDYPVDANALRPLRSNAVHSGNGRRSRSKRAESRVSGSVAPDRTSS